MSITLTKDTTSLTLPGPTPGAAARVAKRQAVGRTAGGEVYAYDKGDDFFEVTLAFESLTAAQKEALLAFFSDTAGGAAESFVYTDENGDDYAARFVDPRLEFVKLAHNVWDVSFTLELDAMGG